MAGTLRAGCTDMTDESTATSSLKSSVPGSRTALLDIQDLSTQFRTGHALRDRNRTVLRAVDGVSLEIAAGETVGLVGESGCGKSTLARTILRLERPSSGRIFFEGRDLLDLRGRRLRKARRQIQVVFQNPRAALDPRMTAAEIVGEGLVVQGGLSKAQRRREVEELLKAVGLRLEHTDRYPHQFSGGQQQRLGIARALALRPKLVIADEPVSALDVSVQAQVLNLLSDLQERYGLTYLFISHDLSVVRHISNRVGVMYLGRIVELAPTEELYRDPRMPYTQALLSAIPPLGRQDKRERIVLHGDPPNPMNVSSGCPFRTRCWRADDLCAEQVPELRIVASGHWAACHYAGGES
jgi:oligopeptide/dipeptide ABC transporter ATP-binding protein